ncbi:MAG TPA: hypothetical protein VGC56_06735 [Allosphingosinicella sp.]
MTFDNLSYEAFEVAAQLYAVLAFPGDQESGPCIAAANALAAQGVRGASPKVRSTWPHYAVFPAAEIRRSLRTLKRRLRDRSWAAWIAFGFLQKSHYKRPAVLPPGMRKMSVGAAARIAGTQTGESDPKNFEKRGWRQSKPVIHLATALARLIEMGEIKQHQDTGTIDFDFEDIKVHRRLVALAGEHAEMLIAHPKCPVSREDLVALHWIE